MTKDEYMEAHHHITESGIGLIAAFMTAKMYDDVWDQIRKVQDELDAIFNQRLNAIQSDIPKRPPVTEYRDCGGVSVV